MNVTYELGEYKFEWDSEKAEKNFRPPRLRKKILKNVASKKKCTGDKL